MRDYKKETELRVAFIRACLADAHATGVVFGNSGGKDCALVGILCKLSCEDTVSIMMPCSSKQNYGRDLEDAKALCAQYGIENRTVDLTAVKEAHLFAISKAASVSADADKNLAPRLRMATLYTVGQSENRLVAGTGNRSERHLGYFTKHGDGAFDFNPIADLTVREVYEFLDYLGAPESIRTKAPSAGLFEGQTDEEEMGLSYAEVDAYLLGETTPKDEVKAKIDRMHRVTEHKRILPKTYRSEE
ncbi:MAG: NAD(+) synthase [Clostridia bacterium]|nr:NAD(+) synthase [Clostridia bacterium]